MNIIFTHKDNSLIARMTGELDMSITENLRVRIDKEFDRLKAKNLLFDLRGVEFIDSSGLGLMLGRYKKVSAQGGQVGIVGADKSVERILDLSGIYKLIRPFNNEGEALKGFQYMEVLDEEEVAEG